jgi:hypothetical protein
MRGFLDYNSASTKPATNAATSYRIALSQLVTSLAGIGLVKQFGFSEIVTPIRSQQEIYRASFYQGQKTRIDLVLRSLDSDKTSIIVTDLFQDQGDTAALIAEMSRSVFDKNLALVLYPIQAGFSGNIDREDLGATSKSVSERFMPYAGRLPFYVLCIARSERLSECLDLVEGGALLFDPRGVKTVDKSGPFKIKSGGRIQRTAPLAKAPIGAKNLVQLEIDAHGLGRQDTLSAGTFLLPRKLTPLLLDIAPGDVRSTSECGKLAIDGNFAMDPDLNGMVLAQDSTTPSDLLEGQLRQDVQLSVGLKQQRTEFSCVVRFFAVARALSGVFQDLNMKPQDLEGARSETNYEIFKKLVGGHTPNLDNLIVPMYRASSARNGGIEIGSLRLNLRIR